jgi:hypothetical protein
MLNHDRGVAREYVSQRIDFIGVLARLDCGGSKEEVRTSRLVELWPGSFQQ